MSKWIDFTIDERKAMIQAVSEEKQIDEASAEKDWWVAYDGFSAKLAEVFSKPEYLSEDIAMPAVAKCSVLYALSALLRKCGCRRGGQGHLKRQENRAVIAWHGAASAGLVSPADRAYMKAPSPVLCRTMGQSVPVG